MSADPDDDLFGRLVAALRQVPREIEIDADVEKVVVKSAAPGGRSTLALVIGSSQSVMFYSVWPDPIPLEYRDACCDYVTKANTGLSTAVLEFNQDTGILAARSGIHFSDLALVDELPETAFVRLLWLALLDVEELAQQHGDGIAALRAH
ncbi:MAG: hypothetical protein JWO57_3677 [Pseudonocardiales bacterium]|nr:hypothetical protein [Pseudonocardiales bacterium]